MAAGIASIHPHQPLLQAVRVAEEQAVILDKTAEQELVEKEITEVTDHLPEVLPLKKVEAVEVKVVLVQMRQHLFEVLVV